MKLKERKGAWEIEEMGRWIIAGLVLVLAIGIIITLKVKGVDLITWMKDIFHSTG